MAFCDEFFCNSRKTVTKGLYLSRVLVPSQIKLFIAARYVSMTNSYLLVTDKHKTAIIKLFVAARYVPVTNS